MRPTGLVGGVAALLVACGGPPEALPSWAEDCAGLAGEHRDWCVFERLQHTPGLGAEGRLAACERLGAQVVRDQCYEVVVRRSPALGGEVCPRIDDRRFRDSCFLEWLRRVTDPDEMSLEEGLAECVRAGRFVDSCRVHVLQQWAESWPDRGGEGAMRSDVATVLRAAPAMARSRGFGGTVARFATEVGYPRPCELFPEGDGRRACIAYGRSSSPGGPPGRGAVAGDRGPRRGGAR